MLMCFGKRSPRQCPFSLLCLPERPAARFVLQRFTTTAQSARAQGPRAVRGRSSAAASSFGRRRPGAHVRGQQVTNCRRHEDERRVVEISRSLHTDRYSHNDRLTIRGTLPQPNALFFLFLSLLVRSHVAILVR